MCQNDTSLPALVERELYGHLAEWPLALRNYADLAQAEWQLLGTAPTLYKVYNPHRAVSTLAKTDSASIARRPCFLCGKNRPAEQRSLPWREYEILVNPYPIFPRHLTIATQQHTAQDISHRFGDLYALANELTGYTVFYNGAHCGASAPDHCHFQAIGGNECAKLPILNREEGTGNFNKEEGTRNKEHSIVRYYLTPASEADAVSMFECYCAAEHPDLTMLNIVARQEPKEGMTICIIPRRKWRPDCYYRTGADQVLISPAAVEVAGVMVQVRPQDNIDHQQALDILREVCFETSI